MDEQAQRHSLWVATTPDFPEYPPLNGDAAADVLVIGGGMTGLQTAYLLKLAGLSVILVERHRLARGTSGHTTAKVTALHGLTYDHLTRTFGREAAQVYAAANVAALDDIVGIVRRETIGCGLERSAACTYATTDDERARVEREVRAAQEAGLTVEFRDDLPLPYETLGGAWLEGQASLHPVRYLKALAELVHGGGCRVHEMTTALDLDEAAALVRTDRGVIRAQHVVVATHVPIFDHGPLSMRLMARRSYVVAAPLPDPLAGMYISASGNHRSVRTQEIDGQQWTITNGEPHRTGEGGDERERYLRIRGWTDDRFVLGQRYYDWATQDVFTVDDLPFIGRYRKEDARVLIATGFKGWGMAHSMVAARIISDAVQRKDNDWAGLYDPWDRSFTKGAGALFSQAAESIKALVIDKLISGDPACTHMGCTTKWNEAERSWDCPCHGSRFDEHGEVLNGPAIRALKSPPAAGG
ncbi:MAG: FAD-dependent oxidoreductase [Actinobacteria bacterium]|nr:FAD-dependent oxidoreductase [Actinomycetota bacterium]